MLCHERNKIVEVLHCESHNTANSSLGKDPTPCPARIAAVTLYRLAIPAPEQGARLAPRLTNSVGMEFVLIPAGTFTMGAIDSYPDEQPVRTVRISQPFYLGKYEVTQAQWEAVMGYNPSAWRGQPNLPVEQVSWE